MKLGFRSNSIQGRSSTLFVKRSQKLSQLFDKALILAKITEYVSHS